MSSVAAIVDKARTSWLKNSEVLELLEGYAAAGLSVCQEPPVKPPGGQLFLFDRRICRFFRRDGHTWRKKPDGKTIRETHEKLKVGNSEALNCYYAHADQDDGLQRRCYWQLDPSKEHIVLVHYLCCSTSRAGTQRACSSELAAPETAAPRPQRATRAAQRRAYSPTPAARPKRSGSQPKLSPLATAASLDGSDLLSQESGDDRLLPPELGLSLEAAAALPSLAQQYAIQQAAAQAAAAAAHATAQLQQLATPPFLAQGRGSVSSASGSGDVDVFGLPPAIDHQRPHPGVLYTDQRVATQLAAAQQQQQAQQLVVGPGVTLPPPPHASLRALAKQESFSAQEHKQLFREMSLGIQREITEDGSSYFLGSPTSEVEVLGGDKAAAGAPTPDLAALLASPPHAAHRRSFSRQGSGLSRLISKNWENDVLEMMLPDVDADISAYPVDGVVIEVAERPVSPSSRLFDQAGIAFFGSAHGSTTTSTAVLSALEPSPLGAASLAPAGQEVDGGGAARQLPFASLLGPFDDQLRLAGEPPASLQFAAGDAHAMAQRSAVHTRLARLSGGVPRNGSHPHLAHLIKGPEEQEQRRKGRVDAAASVAASVAQEHRDEKLAAARSMRAASSVEAEETLEMIDVPENMQRLSSFLHRGLSSGGRLTLGRELAAAEAVADLELEARSLLKHMSIDEGDAVAALRDATKELEVMPTIPAAPGSEVDAASGAPSLSEELGSRNHSVSSLLEGMQASSLASPRAGAPLDPVAEQLRAAMAQHAARQAR